MDGISSNCIRTATNIQFSDVLSNNEVGAEAGQEDEVLFDLEECVMLGITYRVV